jgi:hypothetical protein
MSGNIDLVISKERLPEEGRLIVERLLLLEDIEEKQDDWLDLNRRLVHFLRDEHVRIAYATFTDAAEQLGPRATLHVDWIRWRRTVLESLLNPTQVQIRAAPLGVDPLKGLKDEPATENTWALRDAYMRDAWRREYTGYWVIIHGGTVSEEKYDTHEAAMGAAIDKYSMLGNFVCPYVSHIYCHYKMQIYESQAAFAQDIRDL